MFKKFCAILAVFLVLAFLFAELHPLVEGFQLRTHRVEMQEEIQYFLNRATRNNAAVTAEITKTLKVLPGAARIRVGLLRLRPNGGLSFDILYGSAADGHELGAFPTDRPLSDWVDFVPQLLANQCKFMKVTDMRAVETRDRILPLTAAFLACPIFEESRLIGATFLSWDEITEVPAATDMPRVEAVMRDLNDTIADVFQKNP